MNEFGNFKFRDGETIRESQVRFQTNLNALKQLGKHIPQEEINMKILSAVPFIYEPKESQSSSMQAPVSQMKHLALHNNDSLLESEDESDEELALISRKIRKMVEKKNRLKRDKGRFFNNKKANKDSKDQTCFECGKPSHYKRDCYKLKSKQLTVFKDKKKAKALMTWSDDDSVSSDDSSGDMVNLALVGLDDDSFRGNSESGYIESDSEEDQSEVNSCKYNLSSEKIVLEPLTMQECEDVSMGEYYSLKAENNKLKEKNNYLKTMVQDLMSKVDTWIDKKVPTQADKEAEIKDLQAKLKKEIEARDECLELFKLKESINAEPTNQAEEPSQQAEIIREESLKSMMNNTNIPLVREGIGMNANKKDKALRYEGKHGIPYDYAMPWKICNRCGKKGHLEKYCRVQNGQKSYHGGNKQKTAYYGQNGRTKTMCLTARVKSTQWILDSGCTRHMSGDKAQFTSLQMKRGGRVTIGDIKTLQILGKGKIGNKYISIDKVQYVKGLEYNLLSISQLYDDGYKVDFGIEKCIITIDTDPYVWHKRLGHAHMDLLNKLSKKKLVRGLPKIKYVKTEQAEPSTPVDDAIVKMEKMNLDGPRGNRAKDKMPIYDAQEEPKNVEEALEDENWITAMQEELNQFDRCDVWELFKPPKNASVIVARLESIRMLLAYVCYKKIKLHQMDVKSAFLNRFLEEEVYVKQPPGFEHEQHPDYIYKLKKALYGLKQASRAWYKRLSKFLIKNGFIRVMQIMQDVKLIERAQVVFTLRDFGIKCGKIPIYCHNTSTINISKNPVNHSRTKHIDVRHHFLRDIAAKGKIALDFVPTEYQLADIFTKPLGEARFSTIRRELGHVQCIMASYLWKFVIFVLTVFSPKSSIFALTMRFTENALDSRPILPGIPVNGKLLQQSGALALFQTVGTDNFVLDLPKIYYPDLVREFYANLHEDKFGNCVSTVRDKRIRLNPPFLSTLIKFENPTEIEVFTGKGYVALPDFSIMDQFKCLLGSDSNVEENPQPPSTTLVTPMAHFLFKICRANVCPRGGNKSTFSCQDVTVVAMILAGRAFNLSHLILKNMLVVVNQNKIGAPYGLLLSNIFDSFKIDLKSTAKLSVKEVLDAKNIAMSNLHIENGELVRIIPTLHSETPIGAAPSGHSESEIIQMLKGIQDDNTLLFGHVAAEGFLAHKCNENNGMNWNDNPIAGRTFGETIL
ncbi:hypothetical protein AgCh_025879 [Apium graveolens]